MNNEAGVADMVLLDPVTEDALLQNLKDRFAASKIYVSKTFVIVNNTLFIIIFQMHMHIFIFLVLIPDNNSSRTVV